MDKITYSKSQSITTFDDSKNCILNALIETGLWWRVCYENTGEDNILMKITRNGVSTIGPG